MNEKIEKNKELKSLPKNIRQMGETESGIKIYMEDYVYTYLHQYGSKNKNQEQLAFLIGEKKAFNDEVVLLISGAIQGKYLFNENGNLKITEDTWSYVYEKIRQYFSDYEVLGWMFTQPGYGILLTSFLIEQHKKQFKDENQVLLIVDPIEKEESFFIVEDNILKKRTGYFIYYDKNKNMHEYMLDYKIVLNNDESIINNSNSVVANYRIKGQAKKEEAYHKRFVRMLSVLCGALVLICVIIGVGLLSNMDEMDELKKSFENVAVSYTPSRDSNNNNEEQKPKNSIPKNQAAVNNEKIDNQPQLNNKQPKKPTKVDQKEKSKTTTENSENKKVVNPQQVIPSNSQQVAVIPSTYTIKTGDSLLSITYRFYKTKNMMASLQKANNINDPDKIYIGQKLILPKP